MKYLLVTLLLAWSISLQAQISNPVQWTFSAKKIAAGMYELHLKANIEQGWHMYAQQVPENTVDPTVITFSKNPLLKTDGKTKENGKLIKSFDKNFGATLPYYEREVSFVQRVAIKGTAKTKMKGMVRFMVCDDHQCLPAKELAFTIPVGG